jgi:hypothetical protein
MKVLRSILAVIAGAILGGFANGFLIKISGSIIPPPPGVDTQTEEGLKAGIHLFEPKHFLFPFLAHAIGTLLGAIIASLISKDEKGRPAYVVGALFLIGGIMMVIMIPAPIWFSAADLLLAYIPMAYLANKITKK